MGTHPTVPSRTAHGTLQAYLEQHPEFIGKSVAAKFPDAASGQLPFLFKVLSIGTALSIQSHPDKELAGRLFAERPDVYKGEYGVTTRYPTWHVFCILTVRPQPQA
jgi:mannose-6-phosphate isomerase